MTRLLEQALEVARQLSPEEQDEIAWGILAMAGQDEDQVYILSDEEKAAIELGRAAAKRGEFATDEEMEALWAKYT